MAPVCRAIGAVVCRELLHSVAVLLLHAFFPNKHPFLDSPPFYSVDV